MEAATWAVLSEHNQKRSPKNGTGKGLLPHACHRVVAHSKCLPLSLVRGIALLTSGCTGWEEM